MGKVIRRVIAILLCATALILAVLPAGSAEATSTHGDYEYDGATIAKYLGSDSEVTLPAWVNRVGKEAFEGYDKMTKLVMPDTVTTVDFGAFSNCGNLETVKMSESVRTLGSSAFSGCTNLYSVSVPRTVRSIGSGVFAGCPSLSSVPVSANNENYTSYDGVIYSKDGKKLVQYLAGRPETTYKMPSAVREIEEYAFWGANNLSKLSISYGVDKIPEYAFSNCKGLQHVTLPRTVQSIFAYAFEDCDSLSYINIPDSVGYIDDRAFANTRGALLRFIDRNGNVVKTFNSEDVDKYGNGTGGAPVVQQPGYLTGNTSGADNSSDGAGPANIQNGTDSNVTSGNGTNIDTNNNTNTNPSDLSTADSNGSTTYIDNTSGDAASFDPTDVTPLDPGDEVGVEGADGTTAAAVASSSSAAGDSQTPAPSNIIDNSDLYNNGYYKASDSGSNPWDTQIEYHDFENNMTDYDLGAGKVLGGTAVLRMSSKVPVKGFNFPNAEYEDTMMDTASPAQPDRDVIGDTFASYTGNEAAVDVPEGVKKIGDRAFYKNEDIGSVSLPSGITDIGEFAFARSGLTDIALPEGTKNIDYAAFYNCPKLTNVSIPGSVDNIQLGAFSGTPFLENWKRSTDPGDYLVVGDGVLLAYKGHDKRVFIPDNIRHIGPGAFAGNRSVESVTITPSVTDIGEEAFSDCTNLRELIMGEGLKNIGDRAFKNSDLKVVYLPDTVEGVGLGAFDNGGKLKTVILNGDNVPNVTYDKSATRLSAKDLRTSAFEGAENAIVSGTCDLNSGTLFDPRFYGFEGDVYSIGSGQNKTLVLERALTQPDASGNVMLNQQVDIAGDTYMLDQVKSDAFDNYRDWSKWTDNKPMNVAVNGERSEALDSLLADVNANIMSAASDDEEDTVRSNITVSVDGKRFPTRGSAYATIPGDTDRYSLSIREDESVEKDIDTAFLHSTGSNPGGGYVPLSMDMYDKSGTVPIHKLGNSKMEVSIPVPSGMENDEGIGIASLDSNGLLENLSSEITDEGDGKNIKFVAGHFSTYVIYSRGHAAAVTYDENGNPIETIDEVNAAANTFDMSGTWRTLNKKVYGPLSPKWFIIIIMLALAGILFLYKSEKKKN